MKPLVVDTSVWVEWLRGKKDRVWLHELIAGRVLYLPAIISLELYAGARETKAVRVIDSFVAPFLRHRRIIIPNEADYTTAGKILAELKWPASPYTNDVLIVVSARKIGAEVVSLNKRDFAPLCQALSVSLHPLPSAGNK